MHVPLSSSDELIQSFINFNFKDRFYNLKMDEALAKDDPIIHAQL